MTVALSRSPMQLLVVIDGPQWHGLTYVNQDASSRIPAFGNGEWGFGSIAPGYNGMRMRYRADITAGALKVPESRIIAGLLLNGVDQRGWKDAIVKENVLQARSPATASRLTRLIRQAVGDDGGRTCGGWSGTAKAAWPPMRSSPPPSSTALCSATSSIWSCGSSTGCSAEAARTDCGTITSTAAGGVTPTCRCGTETTRRRLRSSVFQTLAQAGYIENTRSLKLQTGPHCRSGASIT